jgi:hypothetical protein
LTRGSYPGRIRLTFAPRSFLPIQGTPTTSLGRRPHSTAQAILYIPNLRLYQWKHNQRSEWCCEIQKHNRIDTLFLENAWREVVDTIWIARGLRHPGG